MSAPLTPSLARCAHHADAPALGPCARCGDLLCAACSDPHGVCAACLAREPLFHVPPMPWELPGENAPRRIVRTLGTLLRPWSRAQAFARGALAPALGFALTVSLPAASVALVIPATRTLLFTPPARIAVIGHAEARAIAVDVVRASLFGVATTFAVSALLFGALFALSAFRDGRLWARHALYWSWLYPEVMLAQSLPAWLGAPELAGAVPAFGAMFVWWLSLWFTVRRARGKGILTALLTSVPAGFAWMFAVAVLNLLTAAPPLVPPRPPEGAEPAQGSD